MFSLNYFSKVHTWRILAFCLAAFVSTISMLATVTVARAAILALPVISATKSDAIIDDGVPLSEAADGKADPGETIEYTVVINNSGPDDATGLTYTDTIDPNTTLSGSASVSPVAINDTLPVTVTGNVAISTALMATPFSVVTNDYPGQNMSPGLTIVGPATFLSAQGGNVSMTLSGANIGQFTYDPPAGFEGTDTFTYTLSNNVNASNVAANRTATVTITVSGMIWFVNNNSLACTVDGCGRLSNPYSTLAAFSSANNGTGNHPAANDNIFIYESATSYMGGITLLNGQKLIGQDSTQTLAAITGLSPVTGSLTLPAMNATPAQSTTLQNAGGNGVTLNTGNTLNGFTASNASGSAIFGSGFGTLTAADVTVNSNGQALNLTNGTLSAVFPSVTSTGGTNNVALTGPLTGTLTISAGALSGATGNAFNMNGGGATINNAATITSGDARSVNVTGLTGGTVTFSGAITDTDTGVSLTSNGGATINFTGPLTISTGTNPAFTATGGGTISATNTTSALTTSTATALNVVNTSIGGSNLIFRSISSSGGSATGIILDNTGSLGGLQVLGDGSNTAFGGNGSGGTITNKSGTDGNNATGIGIYLNSTSHVVLRRMNLSNFNNFAIRGLNVNNFVLEYCTINHSSGKIGDNAAVDEGSIYFGIENPGGTNGLTGTATVTSCLIEDGFENNFKIANLSGTLSQFTMTGSTVRDTSNVSPGNNGLEFRVQGTANVAADITTSTFSGNRANGIQVTTTTEHTGVVDVEVGVAGIPGSGGTFTNNNIGVNIAHGSAGTLSFDVHRGIYNSSPGLASPININLAAGGGGPMSGWVTNNTITNANSPTGPGIRVTTNGTDVDNSNILTIAVNDNNISLVGNRGIEMIARDGNSDINATVNNNIVQLTDPLSADGIRIDAGVTATDTTSVCLAIAGNNSDTAGTNGIRIRNRFAGTTFRLPSYGGAPTDGDGTHDAVIAHLVGLNGLSSNISADHAVGNSGFTSGAPCATPVAMQPNGNDILAQAQPESNPQAELAIAPQTVSILGRSNLDAIVRSAVVEAPVIAPVAQASDVNLGGGKPLFALVQPAPALSGETVMLNIGTLPAGKSVTITFRATVDALDPGEVRTRILNQGTVDTNELPDVLTTDPSPNPDPACATAGTQTCTPVDRPDTTVVSLTRQSANPSNSASVTWQIVFANPVDGLENSNFSLVSGGLVSGAAITSVTETSGPPSTTWNITATTGTGDGTLELRMVNDTGLSHDVTNQPYTEPASGAEYTIDKTAPTVTINQAVGQSDPTNGSPISFTVVFSEDVGSSFATGDVTLSGGAGATTGTVSETAPMDGTTYNVAVSGMTGDGTVIASILANQAQDLAGNTNTASTSTDNTVTYDGTQPTVTINQAVGQSDPTGSSPINFTVVFSEDVGASFATGDVSLSGGAGAATGTVSETAPMDGTTYNVAVSGMTSDGTVIASILANQAQDLSGNTNLASTSSDNSVVYDTVAPSVTINQAVAQTDPTNNSPINFTVVFSEAVTDFDDAADVSLSGTAGATTSLITGGPTTYNVAVSGMTGVGTIIASIPAGVAVDVASQPNSISTSTDNTVTYDNSLPDTTIDSNPANPTTSANANFTFSGSDTGSGVASFECNLDAGGFGACTSPEGYTGLSDGSHTFEVRAIDNAGNVDATPATYTWVVDTTAPNTTITNDPVPTGLTNATGVTFNFTGNDGSGVGGLTFECRLDTAPYGACNSGSISYSGLSDGSHTFYVYATDSLGNADATPATYTWTVDTAVPSVILSSLVTSPTNNSPILVTITFSEPVDIGTGAGDLNITNSPADPAISGGPTVYTFDLTPGADGPVTAQYLAGSAVDMAGNANTASNIFSITYDSTAPTVTIDQASGQLDPTNASPVNFTVIFSEAATDFDDAADVILTGTAGATTAAITGGPTTYNVAVSGMTSSGTVIATIPAGVVLDLAANTNIASTSTDNEVNYIYDVDSPVVVSSVRTDPNPTAAASVSYTVTFSEPVSGVDAADFVLNTTGTISGAAVTGVSGTGTTYTVTVSTGTGTGTLRLDIPATATIVDLGANPLSGLPYLGGEAYTVRVPDFGKTAPTDGAASQSLSPTLSWQASYGATSYEYCYSSAPGPCTKWNSVGTDTSVALSGLAANYTYYWQVRAVDAGGTTEADSGTWWSFTTTATLACTWPPYTAPATPTFGDVPMDAGHWSWVERLANSTITSGCGAGNYCPYIEINRAQTAIFLLRGKHCGSAYIPPAVGASTGFADVPLDASYAPWVKQLAAEGITAGCGGGNFCPLQVVNRAQMAIFLLRAKHGATYSPPAIGTSTGFADVPLDAAYAAWVKQLAVDGITAGCGDGNFCPLQNVNRAQMATFLVRTFGLP